MVTEKDLKAYGFVNMLRYYLYIHESLVNGQRKQAIDLCKALSTSQKRDAKNWAFSFLNEEERKAYFDVLI